ncbi:hypothetical protein JK358_36480 [Nocardia sp. 2]|uniref:Uncharacterized protein n=1 Tax=Nocardia acididurans TaxID=2802282 RepID=A0ABS1MGW7_9NOCA|nr:hypothetical protein [Nocardia acididurans]MBL1079908.1 hypothetical protein [Nocardia acididurans]
MRFGYTHRAFLDHCEYFVAVGKHLEEASLSAIAAETALQSRHAGLRNEAVAQYRRADWNLTRVVTTLNVADGNADNLTRIEQLAFERSESAARIEVAGLRSTLLSISERLSGIG